jgi:hypothetical protein
VLVEFAIALPLLILLGYGLAIVGVKIFQLGKEQLADYVLENEAQYVIERITHQARAAKEVVADNQKNQVKFVYHTAVDANSNVAIADVWETQYFVPYKKGDIYRALDAKRQLNGSLSNPITGDNSFGGTKINSLKFAELNDNVLHVSLEMESLVTGRKIKIDTAIFMPSCTHKEGLPRE